MDITPHISDLAASRDQVQILMAETTTVACFGSRALLSLFVCAAPVPQSVVAAVTTEAEGLDRVKQHRPVLTNRFDSRFSCVQHVHLPLRKPTS